MFGSLVQKLQTLSPIGSPVTSPVSSPKARRRKGGPKWRRQQAREEYREVQSDPETQEESCKPSGKKRVSIGPPVLIAAPHRITLLGSKSLGRLDGLKEVRS
jgi:hypothetical protein